MIIKTCRQCKNEFKTKRAKQIFCCRRCKDEFGRGPNYKPTRMERNIWIKKLKQESFDRMMSSSFEDLSWDLKKRRIIVEQNNKCDRCGIDEWLKESISLEIDHIDGDNSNTTRDNLQGLCPNCHSLTPTWRGRNKRIVKHISDEELIAALKHSSTVRQALLLVGMAAKGKNYTRATQLLREMYHTCSSRQEIEQTAIFNSSVMKKIIECEHLAL